MDALVDFAHAWLDRLILLLLVAGAVTLAWRRWGKAQPAPGAAPLVVGDSLARGLIAEDVERRGGELLGVECLGAGADGRGIGIWGSAAATTPRAMVSYFRVRYRGRDGQEHVAQCDVDGYGAILYNEERGLAPATPRPLAAGALVDPAELEAEALAAAPEDGGRS